MGRNLPSGPRKCSPPQSLSSVDPTLDSGVRGWVGALTWRGPGERAEGNRQEERKPCLGFSHPEKGRTGPEGNGGAPVRPGRLEVGGVPVRKHPEGPATPGKPPKRGGPPSPVAGVTFVYLPFLIQCSCLENPRDGGGW